MYNAEYYNSSACDESDPDPDFVTAADNTDDVFTAIERHIKTAIVTTYLDTIDGYDRYGINDKSTPSRNVGVVLIGIV